MAGATLASRPIAILAMAVLARLLDPSDFGTVALAMVLFSTAQIFSGLGMGSAVVQSRRDPREVGFQAFAITVVTSLLLFAAINVRIDAFSQLLGNIELSPILRWMSLLLLFDAWSIVPEALLRRELNFGRVSASLVVFNVVTNSVSIALALLGFGLWSLVWGQLAGSLVRMLMIWFSVPTWDWLRPQQLNLPVQRELISYGIKSTSGGLVNFVNSNWDDWYVGRVLGTTLLGFYDKAYVLTNGTIAGLNTTILSGVFMPSYAQIQDDTARLGRVYLKSLGLSAIFMAPLSMGVFAVAPELVVVLFGAKWTPMIPTLQIFAFMALARPLAASTSPLFRAVGRPEYDFQGGLVVLATMVPMVLYMARWGIEGVALAVTLSFVCGLVFNIYKLERLIPDLARQMLPVVMPSLIASAAMIGVVYVSRLVLSPTLIGQQLWLLLLVLTIIGGLVFVLLAFLLQRRLIVEMIYVLGEIPSVKRLAMAVKQRLSFRRRVRQGELL